MSTGQTAGKYFEGIGRRKSSTARVRIYKGTSASIVNDKPVEQYFAYEGAVKDLTRPLTVSGLEKTYYFTAKVSGGGMTGQKEAVQLGLARAILNMDPDQKETLRQNDLVTRDPRMVESKKYNHKKARKKPQFSKR